MSRFFFHLQNGRYLPDSEGLELDDIRAARLHAIRMSADILSNEEDDFWDGVDWQITVAGGDRLPLFTLNFHGETARPDSCA